MLAKGIRLPTLKKARILREIDNCFVPFARDSSPSGKKKGIKCLLACASMPKKTMAAEITPTIADRKEKKRAVPKSILSKTTAAKKTKTGIQSTIK